MAQQVNVTVRQISAATSEAAARQHRVLCDRPESKGGDDKGPMGGEMFLMGLGGCFLSNLLAAVKARAVGASELRVEVMATLVDAPSRFSEIELKVSGNYPDRDTMNKLVLIAERGCIVANTIRDAVKLTVSLA